MSANDDTILAAVMERLRLIRVGNSYTQEGLTLNYQTDAGARVFKGLEAPDENEDGPILSVWMQDHEYRARGPNCQDRHVTGTLLIAAWVKPDTVDSLSPLTAVLQDLLAAVYVRARHPDLDTRAMNYWPTGSMLSPKGDGGTFAMLVLEGIVEWMEIA